ncbi:hypothetical protein OESDEN_10826 [Oesophagostomum dentatum]|uniref:Uncharacterized protein n=1 Tax=Oesophagostomum dentatum TaxID=61180 RepID=A0A0B1T1Q6_OESDE|nr:hypothetical protein OESDEN_10826 [Oesophagostomum dentatum]
MWFGMIGGFLFILIQLILIVDFAHGLAENWVDSYEETESRWCYAGLLTFTFGCFAAALTGIVLMFIFYTTVCAECSAQAFLSITGCLGSDLCPAEVLHLLQYDSLHWR